MVQNKKPTNGKPTTAKPTYGSDQSKIMRYLLWITVLLAAVYLYSQWKFFGAIRYPFFVGFILANSVVVYRYFFYLRDKLPTLIGLMQTDNQQAEGKLQHYLSSVFSPAYSTIAAVIYGCIIAGSIYFLQLAHTDDKQLRFSLCFFLLFHNAMIGIAVYSLVVHLKQCSTSLSRMVPVSLWNRSNPIATEYFRINQSVVIVVSIICAVAVLSLFSSAFKPGLPVMIFSITCIGLISFSYLVPIVSITQQLRAQKDEELNRLGKLIAQSYQSMNTDTNSFPSAADMEQYKHLNELLDQVNAIQTFPPIGIRTAETAAYALLITLLPSMVNFITENMTP